MGGLWPAGGLEFHRAAPVIVTWSRGQHSSWYAMLDGSWQSIVFAGFARCALQHQGLISKRLYIATHGQPQSLNVHAATECMF